MHCILYACLWSLIADGALARGKKEKVIVVIALGISTAKTFTWNVSRTDEQTSVEEQRRRE